jgi:hypothetical protein
MGKNKKEVVGTKYFLILFAKFGENEKLLHGLLSQFERILSSKYLKYQPGEDFVITHFESESPSNEIKELCKFVLDGTVKNYILIPNNKNVTLSLSNDILESLLDLDTNDSKFIEKIDINDVDYDFNPIDFNQMDDDDDIMMGDFFKLLYGVKKEPSLDELLDKVQKNGFKSLTKIEKTQLYDYSKRI